MPERGMGKGLKALLGERSSSEGQLRSIPVDLIKPNPQQPRAKFKQEELQQLSESIASHGLLQPVLVRPLPQGTYELIAGERRWRASIKAGLKEIPAVLKEDGSDAGSREGRSLELALVENMLREDLDPIEEAKACAELIDRLDLTQEQAGAKIGRSRVAVANLLRLLDLPDEVQRALVDGELSEGHGRAILQCRDQKQRKALAQTAIEQGLSVRQLELMAKESEALPPRARITGGKASVRLHPDLEQARCDAEDALSAALGQDVRVRISGKGAKAELYVGDVRELQALAERISVSRAAVI